MELTLPVGFTAVAKGGFNSLSPPSRLFPVQSISSITSRKDGSVTHYHSDKQKIKNKNSPPRASSAEGGIPNELAEEESKFVPLNSDDPVFGPPALLLLGFEVEEAAKIQQLLQEMGGEFLKLVFCTEDMISRSLWEAMNTDQPNLEVVKVAKSLPRICFLSGLSGEEMMMFIDAFPETGVEAEVFAAMVPNSADKSLYELVEEIMGDHEMMTRRQSESLGAPGGVVDN
ncbi:unnamed protein product [Linum tenue]|uniref:Uncharacterized protein n=1 Tax=Linum tenue TaxID=586396 RepID=A0AAV0JNI0_9ROSI|nr:unnamed protein product [Linum tenue]